jgi:hypothetical protein
MHLSARSIAPKLVLFAAISGAALILTGFTVLQIAGVLLVSAALLLPVLGMGRSQVAMIPERAHQTPVSQLGLPEPIVEVLREVNIETVAQVLHIDPEALLTLPGFGPKELIQLRDQLASFGFLPTLAGEEEAEAEALSKWRLLGSSHRQHNWGAHTPA